MGVETVYVPLGERAYDVRIGPGLIARAGAEIAPVLARPKAWVVTEETVAGLHLEALRAGLAADGIEMEALVLPPGEATKSWPFLMQVVEWLLDQKVERRDVVVAFGGGVIGDLVGFAAAVLRRGVRFVQIPTSLLAQVDSSVGVRPGSTPAMGKTWSGRFISPHWFWQISMCWAR
ncbi:iron-containing alcohol dehydrogenase [Fontisubflavum oceani]|nr:iron-containing alcohol dehydrogenase [Fontisubflavum oceani]WJY21042.1 iron-containing alcohol dehydrogenase [Fontisubflavum oceani]